MTWLKTTVKNTFNYYIDRTRSNKLEDSGFWFINLEIRMTHRDNFKDRGQSRRVVEYNGSLDNISEDWNNR
jgi:hypothetical protein